jgi:F-type H+-transporting ATPase subunit delta
MHVQSVQLRVSLTGRYATALYKEASSTKSTEAILNDINTFNELLKSSKELEHILKSNFLSVKDTLHIWVEVGKLMNFSELFLNFLKVIVTNRRGTFLQNIFKDFLSLIDIQTNTIPIRIEVAQIEKSNISAIERLLKKMYSDQAYRFENHHAPELLGGFRVFIRERCLDYSLKSRLNRLSYQLKEA